MLRTILCLALPMLALALSAAVAGDLEWSDPERQLQPPVGAVGYPSRDPNLDALPGFQKPPPGYGEVAFYWWLGDPLTKERLRWQIERLSGKGVMGLQINYAHSDRGGRSYGLTYPSDPPLFSEPWWNLVGWFLKEARKNGMAVSLSDYTLGVGQGWYMDEVLRDDPSLRGSTLAHSERRVEGGQELAWELPENLLSLMAYRLKDGAVEPGSGVDLRPRLDGRTLRWQAPEGWWQVVEVHFTVNPYSLDPMNLKSGPAVVARFFQRFEDRNPGEAGKGLNFFFSDELDFGVSGNLWTARFAEEFRKRKGYDLIPELPALFTDIGPRTPKVRLDYRDVMVALSEEGFFRPVHEWHVKRGMIYGCDHGGRGRNVVEFGDYFRAQRWMSGPGCDQPGLAADVIKNKVASSIAHLYQRPRTWLEGYHSSGWGTGTAQLSEATFRNFAQGQNLLTLHGLYYSTHGGWWEWAPPCNHFRMPYWEHMGEFLHCTERLSYLMSQGVHRCDVAILYPVAPMEAGLGGNEAVQTAFSLGRRLYDQGIDFDFIDFESLARAQVKEKELRVSGEAYRVLVLPAMRAVRWSTLQKAQEFARAGGSVIAIGALPEASDRAGRDDPELDALVKGLFGLNAREAAALTSRPRTYRGYTLSGQPGIRFDADGTIIPSTFAFTPEGIEGRIPRDFEILKAPARTRPAIQHRKVGARDVYMVYGVPKGTECFFRARGKVELWDPWTGKTRPVFQATPTGDGTKVRLPLDATEPQILIFSPGDPGPTVVNEPPLVDFSPGTPRVTVESTALDEVVSVDASGAAPVVRGYADTAGPKSASVMTRHGIVTLYGQAPEPLQPLALDAPWEFELKPTRDNRFGDFRWPPTNTLLGADVQRLRYCEESAPSPGWQDPRLDDSKWGSVTCAYGPRFWKLGPLPDGADTAALEAKLAGLAQVDPSVPVAVGGKEYRWQPYSFSWRWGIEGDPGHQGYHGLKEEVGDEFIGLGKLGTSMTNTSYGREEGGSRYYLWSSVTTSRTQRVQARVGGNRPAAVWLNGAPVKPGTVKVQAGANPLLLRYDAPGRGYFALEPGKPDAPDADAGAPFSKAAFWIWEPAAGGPVVDRCFRKAFDLPAVPAKARLRITADNAYTLFVNGQEIGRGSSWQRVQECDVAGRLRRGRNVMAVLAHNDGGDAGLIAELVLGTRHIATDATWRCAQSEAAGWRTPEFDDSGWAPARQVSPFEGSLWATHEQGPPKLDAPTPAAPAAPAKLEVKPLAMGWLTRPVLPFDLCPQVARPAGWYRFTAAPGLRALTITAFGQVQAWADGREMAMKALRRLPGGATEYRATVAGTPLPGCACVALRVEQVHGCYGGAALPEPVLLDCAPGELALGDWSQVDGLASYSGGAWYRKTVTLSPERAQGQVLLDLGGVCASCEVRVNGKPAGIRVAPPWRFDVSALVRPGENRIEVLVYNTLANHYQTIPTRYRGSPLSGLLGPVTIRARREVVLR